MVALRSALVTALALIGGADGHLRGGEVEESSVEAGRRLSSSIDLLTAATVRTYNGKVPRVPCEPGFYRPLGTSNLQMITGQRLDGCIQCPRGTYGSQSGLTDRACSGSCPAGTFSNLLGRTSISDCMPCPLGRYGTNTGQVQCQGVCPTGTYTADVGSTAETACLPCRLGEELEPCRVTVLPRRDRRTGLLNS